MRKGHLQTSAELHADFFSWPQTHASNMHHIGACGLSLFSLAGLTAETLAEQQQAVLQP